MGRPQEGSGSCSVSHIYQHHSSSSSFSLKTKDFVHEIQCTPPLQPLPVSYQHAMLRPSSSDGLRSHGDTLSGFVVDKRLDKRISRDDSWIVTGKAGARARQYIPPRGLPTPDPSPTSNGAAEPQYAPGPWVQTPREEGIGMAIGSPSLAPPWDTSISRNQPSSGSPATTSPSIGAVDGPLPGVPVPRKGSGKWKIFGMFGRRPSDTVSSGFSPVPSQASLLASRARAETSKESSTAEVRNKPPISRSQTMPSPREFGKDARRRPSMSRMKKPRPTDLVPPMPSPYGNNTTFTESAISQSALLDVNIPSIELERYSIMFEKVLNPQRTSLLARRQGALEQLKTVGESKSERKVQPSVVKPKLSCKPTNIRLIHRYPLYRFVEPPHQARTCMPARRRSHCSPSHKAALRGRLCCCHLTLPGYGRTPLPPICLRRRRTHSARRLLSQRWL